MRYSKLIWSHTFPNEPVEIYSEHDDQGWERRKVEIFRDGSMGFASPAETPGDTKLSLIQCPPDEDVNREPVFRVVKVPEDEFERIWIKACQRVKSA